MDRDRDEPDRMPERGRERDRGGSRMDPPSTGKFNMSDWDAPTDPVPAPSPAARTRGDADSAQAFSLFSAIDTGIQRILANFGMIRDVVADARASVAEAAADAAKRAEEQEIRDKAIQARLIDPERLGAYGAAGAKAGVKEAIGETVADLKRRIDADAGARELLSKQMTADQADRRAHDARRRQQDGWWYGALAGAVLLVPIAGGYGYYLGSDAGEASAYARTRDETAAASWANTPNGKLARQLDHASEQTIPAIAGCPKDHGWHSEKANGRRWCYGTSKTAKMISGWALP